MKHQFLRIIEKYEAVKALTSYFIVIFPFFPTCCFYIRTSAFTITRWLRVSSCYLAITIFPYRFISFRVAASFIISRQLYTRVNLFSARYRFFYYFTITTHDQRWFRVRAASADGRTNVRPTNDRKFEDN